MPSISPLQPQGIKLKPFETRIIDFITMIQPILRSSLRARSTIGAVRYAGISTTAIRRAEVTTLQPQDLVEKSLKPGAEADPQRRYLRPVDASLLG